MPGYGYARASKAAVKGWTRLIRDYLRGRRELKRVFLLIDARHGIKANDKETMKLLDEAAVSYQVVLTKADKPKASELADSPSQGRKRACQASGGLSANPHHLGAARGRHRRAARGGRQAACRLAREARPDRRDPDQRGQSQRKEHARRGEILGDADRLMLVGLDVIAEPLDRRVEELDRQHE